MTESTDGRETWRHVVVDRAAALALFLFIGAILAATMTGCGTSPTMNGGGVSPSDFAGCRVSHLGFGGMLAVVGLVTLAIGRGAKYILAGR